MVCGLCVGLPCCCQAVLHRVDGLSLCVAVVLLQGDAALKRELLKFMSDHPAVARFAVSSSHAIAHTVCSAVMWDRGGSQQDGKAVTRWPDGCNFRVEAVPTATLACIHACMCTVLLPTDP